MTDFLGRAVIPSWHQRGMTLVELMISVTIGLMIMAGVVQLYASQTKTQQIQEGTSRLQENARFVFARMEKELAQTGYVGCFNFDPERITNVIAGESGNGQRYDLGEPLEIANGTGFPGATTDVITFRYASVGGRIPLVQRSKPTEDLVLDKDHPNYSQLEQYDIVMVSDCSRAAVFMVTNVPDATGVIKHDAGVTAPSGANNAGQSNSSNDLENDYGVTPGNEVAGGSVAYVYAGGNTVSFNYALNTSQRGLATGGACTLATPEFCALYRNMWAGANGEEIAEGVHDFQVEVGWIDAAGNVRFTDPGPAVDWTAVDRLRITLGLNSVEAVPDNTGASVQTKTFTRTIMIRNQVI